jgi:hypothetical protein
MGFSPVAEALPAAHPQHASWTRLISKFGYSVGFLIVILGRATAFYRDHADGDYPAVVPATFRKIKGVLRTVILAANLIGAQASREKPGVALALPIRVEIAMSATRPVSNS